MPSLAALRPASAAVLVVVIVLAPLPASAWRVRVPHTVSARPIALEGNGDMFAVLGIPIGPHAAGVAVAKLAASSGDILGFRTIDGRSTASQCDAPDCEGPFCGPPRAGIDQDQLTALAIDPRGRIVIAGALSAGPHGERHGLVAAMSPEIRYGPGG